MKKIALAGFPLDKEDYQSIVVDAEIYATPSMGALTSMSKEDLRSTLSSLSNFDLVVWNLGGVDPCAFIWQLKILGLFSLYSNRTYKSVFWTMDSHHMGQREKRAQKHFDHIFVAHSAYLDLFPSHKTTFLPCSYSLTSLYRTSELLSVDSGGGFAQSGPSVVSIFSNYAGQSRNFIYFWIAQKLEMMGVKYFFGTARGGSWENQALVETLMGNSVVLNVSLADDLNMRNFEGLALNRILLTNQTADHEILRPYADNIVYFRRDLADFREKALEALGRSPVNISDSFLFEHHISTRVRKIVDVILGRGFIAKGPVDNSGNSVLSIDKVHERVSGASAVSHSNLDLLIKSGTGFFTSSGLKYSLNNEGILRVFKSVPQALTSILKSLAVMCVGDLSLPRSLARAVRNRRQPRQ